MCEPSTHVHGDSFIIYQGLTSWKERSVAGSIRRMFIKLTCPLQNQFPRTKSFQGRSTFFLFWESETNKIRSLKPFGSAAGGSDSNEVSQGYDVQNCVQDFQRWRFCTVKSTPAGEMSPPFWELPEKPHTNLCQQRGLHTVLAEWHQCPTASPGNWRLVHEPWGHMVGVFSGLAKPFPEKAHCNIII